MTRRRWRNTRVLVVLGMLGVLAIAYSLGYLDDAAFQQQLGQQFVSMKGLRSGSHGEQRGKAKEYLNAVMKGTMNAL